MIDTAIIIVNWNGERFLKNCLESVFNQTYKNFIVYFVDNGSIDDSVVFVRNNFQKITIIKLDKNYGFARPNNIGIKQALKNPSIKHVVLLNNDTIVDSFWLEELIEPVKKDKTNKTGMIASKSVYTNHTIQNAGISALKNKYGCYINFRARGNSKSESDVKFNVKKQIFGPSGNSALYTRALLEEIGLFDEDFFAYIEDIDLAYRANEACFIFVYNPKSKLIHYHSQTEKVASPFKVYYSKRNLYLMAIKNYTIMDFFYFLLFDFKSMFKLLKIKDEKLTSSKFVRKAGKFELLRIVTKIYLSILVLAPKMIYKRLKNTL